MITPKSRTGLLNFLKQKPYLDCILHRLKKYKGVKKAQDITRTGFALDDQRFPNYVRMENYDFSFDEEGFTLISKGAPDVAIRYEYLREKVRMAA